MNGEENYLQSRQAEPAINDDVRSNPNILGGSWETKPGWVIDPADGQRVYRTGRGKLAKPDYEVHTVDDSADDYDVMTTYGIPEEKQGRGQSPDDVKENDRREQEYWKQVYKQREQQAGTGELSQRDMWQLANKARGDSKFHKFMETFDPSQAPKLNAQQTEMFQKACKMLGSKMENANDPYSVSPAQILGALTYYNIAKETPQSNDGLTAEQRRLVHETEARLASEWSIQGDTREYDSRMVMLGQIAEMLPASDVEKINRDPIRGAKALWAAFEAGKLDKLLAARGMMTSQGYRSRRRG